MGYDVVNVVEEGAGLDDFGSAEALVADTHLTAAQVRIALAYRDAYPEEIEAAVADNRRPVEDLETLYPFVEVPGRQS